MITMKNCAQSLYCQADTYLESPSAKLLPFTDNVTVNLCKYKVRDNSDESMSLFVKFLAGQKKRGSLSEHASSFETTRVQLMMS
ncbi:MAG TPA: hypothetical protein PLK80_07150 [bacterium]|nr:hypothetical protein [bacterium]HPI76497.1 hypothetical protein [bacterium]HPN93253.1 hypothetical protein [bacterium]